MKALAANSWARFPTPWSDRRGKTLAAALLPSEDGSRLLGGPVSASSGNRSVYLSRSFIIETSGHFRSRTMKEANKGTPVQPSLGEMFGTFLAKQAEAQAFGIAPEAGDVVPFEAVPVQPVDAKLAWDEARSALSFFGVAKVALKAPAEWATLVSLHEPTAAVALAAGNFPQLVRDLHQLLSASDRTALRPSASRPLPAPGLAEWADGVLADKKYPQSLLAIAALRLARQFDEAEARLMSEAQTAPEEWRAALENERAALAWHRGQTAEAAALWAAQPESVPVLFNRGMAALFLGKPAEARATLARAVAQLPEDNAWHHLGRLYLALAEMN
jgi:tetratricopeptide (TPR) repeat protein